MCSQYKYIICLCLFLSAAVEPAAQELANPFDFPILLSGNFGELRNDHFHAGIDFKTRNVEGMKVHAVLDGYISRIVVSPWGYGNALYINHPNGTTSVYGHLQRFAGHIGKYVKEQQYAQESFAVDLTLSPGQFPVKKRQIIASSGNTGSSAGPHLHLEIRNTATGMLYDPLEYYKELVKDTRPPRIEGFMIYPMEGRGSVNGSNRKTELKLPAGKIEAWGDIALAVKAYDYMDGTSNIYGVRRLAMAVDSQVIFSSHLNCFPPNETRYINSFIDYEAWKEHRAFYMKTFVEPGNRLSFIKHINRGIIRINQEKTYRIAFRLRDLYGNLTQYAISIEGKRQDIAAPATDGEYFHYKAENRFGAKGIRLLIPPGCLYDDIYFRYAVQNTDGAIAGLHHVHMATVPLHDRALLSLHIQTDTLGDKRKYGIVRLQNKRALWIGGTYRNGWIDANIRDFGSYTVMQDTRPPVITPLSPSSWISARRITFRVSDDLSGIQSFRGEIDGQFVLFEWDGKKNVFSCRLDEELLTRGRHNLEFKVTDACGNPSEYKHSFVW
jgi:murein DD-endopeptidase MepM/ murein hydrolase activator NlpD